MKSFNFRSFSSEEKAALFPLLFLHTVDWLIQDVKFPFSPTKNTSANKRKEKGGRRKNEKNNNDDIDTVSPSSNSVEKPIKLE